MIQSSDEDLVIEWVSPPNHSDSSYTYTIIYDTVPPSSESVTTMSGIQGLSTTIFKESLVFDHTCSVGVHARDVRTTFLEPGLM